MTEPDWIVRDHLLASEEAKLTLWDELVRALERGQHSDFCEYNCADHLDEDELETVLAKAKKLRLVRENRLEAELAKLRMDIDSIRGFYHHSHQDAASYSGICHRCLLDQLTAKEP